MQLCNDFFTLQTFKSIFKDMHFVNMYEVSKFKDICIKLFTDPSKGNVFTYFVEIFCPVSTLNISDYYCKN